ncbi:hypothetical protein ACF1B0_27065 [Streptomyces anandii]|uniref:hypothetical protein n=1 Tax=Streptomyces anandii TaxID=285454 RepID=UPI0036F5F298
MPESADFPADSPAPGAPAPQRLCDIPALTGGPVTAPGVVWKLAESGRQLDANVVRLPAGLRIDTHTERDLDVLLLVVAGDGVLGSGTADAPQPLTEGALFWLPHGSTRSVTAGAGGLSYVTVHRRRPGMQVRPGPPPAPGA